ncbi:MAG: hypothetical protein EPN47_05725 [Acidobacteria bacterium]|nr:MAG: hypothetical protein EPN47_05725 [Acidobacteriota bacterium]
MKINQNVPLRRIADTIRRASAPAAGFGGLFGINEGRVVDATNTYGGLEAHYDAWGPLNPFHWGEAILSLLYNTRSQAGAGTPYTCSVIRGCHP